MSATGTSMAQISATRALDITIAALDLLRERLDPNMPVQMAAVFLVVARWPGITMTDLAGVVGMSQASCSRNVAALSRQHRLGKSGHDVLEATEDPAERRRKIVRLTPKGETIVSALMLEVGKRAP